MTAGTQQVDRVIGDFGQDTIDRHDQGIDAEFAGDPANAAASPASGCRPRLKKAAAPSGINTK
jgi:hypothetical protein